jgi:hypothetical protein
LHIQNAIDADLHVVFGDANLLRNIERFLFQVVLVRNAFDERHEDVEACLYRAAISAEILDDECALLRHDCRRLHDDDDDDGDDG